VIVKYNLNSQGYSECQGAKNQYINCVHPTAECTSPLLLHMVMKHCQSL
jgi:hypothetical protein